MAENTLKSLSSTVMADCYFEPCSGTIYTTLEVDLLEVCMYFKYCEKSSDPSWKQKGPSNDIKPKILQFFQHGINSLITGLTVNDGITARGTCLKFRPLEGGLIRQG